MDCAHLNLPGNYFMDALFIGEWIDGWVSTWMDTLSTTHKVLPNERVEPKASVDSNNTCEVFWHFLDKYENLQEDVVEPE